MLHNYRGPFPAGGVVDLGPYCGDVDYVSTVEPVAAESSGLFFLDGDSSREGDRPGRGRRPTLPSDT